EEESPARWHCDRSVGGGVCGRRVRERVPGIDDGSRGGAVLPVVLLIVIVVRVVRVVRLILGILSRTGGEEQAPVRRSLGAHRCPPRAGGADGRLVVSVVILRVVAVIVPVLDILGAGLTQPAGGLGDLVQGGQSGGIGIPARVGGFARSAQGGEVGEDPFGGVHSVVVVLRHVWCLLPVIGTPHLRPDRGRS